MVEGPSGAISRNGMCKREDRAGRKNVKQCSRLGASRGCEGLFSMPRDSCERGTRLVTGPSWLSHASRPRLARHTSRVSGQRRILLRLNSYLFFFFKIVDLISKKKSLCVSQKRGLQL